MIYPRTDEMFINQNTVKYRAFTAKNHKLYHSTNFKSFVLYALEIRDSQRC